VKGESVPFTKRPVVLSVARLAADFGGALKNFEEVVTSLLASGADVHIALYTSAPPTQPIMALVAAGARLYALDDRCPPAEMARQLDALVRQLGADIVHVNVNSRYARQSIPLMTTLQGPDRPKRLLTLHSDVLTVPDRPGTPWLRRKLKARNRLASVRRFVECFDRVISVSELCGDDLRRRIPSVASVQMNLPYGVDADQFRPRAVREAARPGQMVVGTAGGFFSYKRFDTLIDAIALLEDRPGVRARIAGGGPLKSSLREQVARLGVEDRVEFAGVQRDMPAFLHQLDVFTMTSDTGEASPYAHLEAMSCGLPTVCTMTGDLPKRIEHGYDGLLARPGDAAGVADALRQLADNPALREAMGARARQKVLQKYSKAGYLARTLGVFEDLLSDVSAREVHVAHG
jgi:glycosyltransferase involved in cell wall biosynthesis